MDDHSSGTSVAGRLARPTRRTVRKRTRGPKPPVLPIRSCSRWGLPCRPCLQARGALLPHPFTLTSWFCNELAVCFLWHFPWGRPRRALPGTVFPWSPDFPPLAGFPDAKGSHPTVWLPICAAASAAGQAIFAQVAIDRAVSESTVASTFVERKCR